MFNDLTDDKGLVIVCATLLGMTSLILLGADGVAVVREVIVGLFGVAVGRSMSK